MVVVPHVFTGRGALSLLPNRTIVKKHACKDKGSATTVLEINIRVVPSEGFYLTVSNLFVPTEVADRPRFVKIPVIPLPVLGGIRKRGVEHQSNNFLSAGISDFHTDARRIKTKELDRTPRRRRGIRRS